METFQAITRENILSLRPYFGMQTSRLCDNTIGAVYQWRNNYRSYFCTLDELLCIRAGSQEKGYHYVFPLGSGDPTGALDMIEANAAATGSPLRYAAVPEQVLGTLQARYGARMRAENPRDWADYLYTCEQFLTYGGKALHTQRNHVNRFLRENPNAETLAITEDLLPACMDFLEDYENRSPEMSATERGEIAGTRDLLLLRQELGQSAYCLMAAGRVIALSIGEVVGDTLFVHAEKANTDFAGIYPAMAQSFVQHAADDAIFVNREDDAGDLGLRYSKTNYRPTQMLEKYRVTVAPT